MSSVSLVDFEGLSVVIVDDDPKVRSVLKALLIDLNVSVIFFDNAFDFLRNIDRCESSLIFLDLILPQMTGIECVRCLRDKGYSKPVFIFSALYDLTLREQSLDAGADDFFLKADFFRDLPTILTRVNEAR